GARWPPSGRAKGSNGPISMRERAWKGAFTIASAAASNRTRRIDERAMLTPPRRLARKSWRSRPRPRRARASEGSRGRTQGWRRGPAERQQEQGHERGERRVRITQPRVVAHVVVGALGALENGDHAERTQVGHGVREQVEEHRALADVIGRQQRDEEIPTVGDA